VCRIVACLSLVALVVVSAVLAVPAAAQPADPQPGTPAYLQRDLANMAAMTGRTQDQLTHPGYQTRHAAASGPVLLGNLEDQLRHPGRPIVSLGQLVPGGEVTDVYRRDWEQQGRGIQVPVEYRNRHGARIQGEVWAPTTTATDPVTGDPLPDRLPGIVITTGSIQGFKEMYWWAAQGLAESGYVVMTYDVQGQGASEVFGHDDDGAIACTPQDCPGVPFQQQANFVEGTQDALDWFLSDANPLRRQVDERRIGLAGHSLGATAVTIVGNSDPRVDAVVGWDNIAVPEGEVPGIGVVGPRVPTMGHNAEVFFTPQPFPEPPDPDAHTGTHQRFVDAGVPSMQVALRSSTHLEWTYVPYILPASRDGERVSFHYTLAWFDRWLKGELHGRPGAARAEVRIQATNARQRLTASTFDASADASALASNVLASGRRTPSTGCPALTCGEGAAPRLCPCVGRRRVGDGDHLVDGCRRETAQCCVLGDDLLVLGQVHAEDLVPSDVALLPLDARGERGQHVVGGLRPLRQLLGRHRAGSRDLPFDHVLVHGGASWQSHPFGS
jgi:dienelactone hydrolase